MRISTVGLGVVSLFSLLAAGSFWRELNAERERSSELSLKLVEATKLIESLEYQRFPVSSSSVQVVPTSDAMPVAEMKGAFANLEQEVPMLSKSFSAQIRLDMPQRFPDLMAELGLTSDQLGRVFDLLAKQQEETRATSATWRGLDEAQRIRASAEFKQRQKEELSALLGTKVSQFEEYKKTQPARQQVAELRRALEPSGFPLRADQVQLLNKAMIDEREQLRQDEQSYRLSRAQESQTPEQYAKKFTELRVESERRLLSTAGAYLTEPQMQALRMQIESRAPISRMEGLRTSAFSERE